MTKVDRVAPIFKGVIHLRIRSDMSGDTLDTSIARVWVTPKKNIKSGVLAKYSRMKDVNWIANTTRGTNDYMHCSHLIYLYDQNINFIVAWWPGDSSKSSQRCLRIN